MKKINLFTVALLSLIVCLSACKKDLDQFPPNAIELTQAFKTIGDARAWNNGIFARFRSVQYGGVMITPDVQADQLNATLDYGNRNGNPHRWGTSFLANDGALTGAWNPMYSGIVNINLGLANIDRIPTATPAEATEIAITKGNAYLARAYYYLELVKRFAKPFEPATAATDPGVPLVLVYDVNAKPGRATVKQIYDQINSDINLAKTNLASVVGVVGANRFTIHTALALEARARLNQKDWAGARTAAEAVIASGTYALASTAAEYKTLWANDIVKESIMQVFVNSTTEFPNTNTIYLGLIPATGKFTPDFVPSQWVVDAFDNADFRKGAYFERKTLTVSGVDYLNIWTVNKYPGNPALFTGANTNYAHAQKVFRVSEMYLISAEAGARESAATEAAALIRLNSLRTARGLTALVGISGVALFDEVRNERFRELAFEGVRLFDLKRWHLGFTRTAPQNINFIQTGPNFNTLSIPVDDNLFTWGIPTNEITTNPNLATAQNPGWQ